MRIIARKTLKKFWEQHPYRDSEQPLRAWFAEAKKANWRKPQDVKEQYGSVSFLVGDRLVFNIGGNKYRLIVAIKYQFELLFIRFIGTHEQYNKIDAKEA